jgi:TolB protein
MRLFSMTAVALFALATPAHATYPGANGKIAYVYDALYADPFHGDDSGSYIYVTNPFGTLSGKISPADVRDADPAWSADGNKIAFTGDSWTKTAIFVMNPDGSNRTQLTSGTVDLQPAWSPDGKKITFVRYTGCNPNCSGSDVWTMNADGTSQTQLTTTEKEVKPTWSPDGTKIAFESGSYVGHDIWTIHPDGSGLTQLTSDGKFGFGLDWSPDGSKLAAIHQQYVSTMTADGTAIHHIFGGGCYFCGFSSPVWSPDSTKIAYVWNPGCFDTCSDAYPRLAIGDVATERGDRFYRASADTPSWQPINRPPDCSSVVASRSVLSTPNHRLIPITLDGATDPDGDPVTLMVDGVTQDEPTGRRPDAVLGPASNAVSLRATRSGHGDGRVYRIAFKATDGRGGECSGTATVGVPRKRNRPAMDSAPPSYDSLVGTPGGGGQGENGQHGHQG